jgi:hypothetical protein
MAEMGDYDRDSLAGQDDRLRAELDASRLRTLVLLLAGTFLLLYNSQALVEFRFRLELPLLRYTNMIAIAPNALAWLFWGTSQYMSVFRSSLRSQEDEVGESRYWHDRLQLASFQLRRQKHLEAMVAFLTSLEIFGLLSSLFALNGR